MSNTGRKSRRRPQRKINQNMKEKLLILFGIVLLLLVILVLRITYINATSGKKYKKQVLTQAQQKYQSSTLPARARYCRQREAIFMTRTEIYWLPAIKFIM